MPWRVAEQKNKHNNIFDSQGTKGLFICESELSDSEGSDLEFQVGISSQNFKSEVPSLNFKSEFRVKI